MTSTDFLKRLCEGYVRSYRTLNLRVDCSMADATHKEINFFGHLGEMLGFVACLEWGRRDLSWLDPETDNVVLYMERESTDAKADAVMKKLFHTERSKAPRYLVGVLGWLKEDHYAKVKQAIFDRLKGRSLLLLAWVGPDIGHATKLEVIVACDGSICTRQATAEQDKDKYWYVRFDGGWRNAVG